MLNSSLSGRLNLKGSKVLLKTHSLKDYKDLRKILNDEKTMRALQPYFKTTYWSLKMAKQRYDHFRSEQKLGKGFNLTVISKKNGKIVGSCGFKNINWKKKKAEFGLILHHSIWGKGVATECFLLCLGYAYTEMGLRKICFTTDIWNERMKGFLKKIGIPQNKKTREGYLCFETLKKDWPKIHSRLLSKLK